MRQFADIKCVSTNRASFHWWWKGNFVKHQKVLKNYENDCRSKYYDGSSRLVAVKLKDETSVVVAIK